MMNKFFVSKQLNFVMASQRSSDTWARPVPSSTKRSSTGQQLQSNGMQDWEQKRTAKALCLWHAGRLHLKTPPIEKRKVITPRLYLPCPLHLCLTSPISR